MTITKQTVADQIVAYLHHEITLGQLGGVILHRARLREFTLD